jgi:hypothetical protein
VWYIVAVKKILDIFDFDGTFANVPERPQQGQDRRGWSGKDWWGSHHSLCSEAEGGFYDGSVNQEVVEAMQSSSGNPQAETVLLTGRRGIIAYAVRRILREYGLHGRRVIDPSHKDAVKYFQEACRRGKDVLDLDSCNHEQYYCGDIDVLNGVHGTLGHKQEVLERKFRQNGGSFETVNIWDDRVDHIAVFKKMGVDYLKQGKVQKFTVHQVFAPVGGAEATIIHVPVTEKTTW